MNPYEPVQPVKKELDGTLQGFGRSLIANWFARDLLLITLSLGIVGFFECIYRNSYYSLLQMIGSLTFALRHSNDVSPPQLLIRTIVEYGLAQLTTIAIFYVLIIGLMLFVPDALSH